MCYEVLIKILTFDFVDKCYKMLLEHHNMRTSEIRMFFNIKNFFIQKYLFLFFVPTTSCVTFFPQNELHLFFTYL